MKFVLVLLALVPFVLAAPNKRLLLDTLFQVPEMRSLVCQLETTLGSTSTEAACESECHVLIKADHLLQFGCPLICQSFNTLVHRFNHCDTATTTLAPPA